MDDILKKFKELSSKEQLGIYAGLALVIGSFLPFIGAYGLSANLMDYDLGFLGLLGGAVGAVCIFLKQRLLAAVAFVAAGVAVLLALIDDHGGASLKFGAFICIAAAAVGIWATIDELIKKMKK